MTSNHSRVDSASLAQLNALTDQIIGASIEVHKALGPGLLESAYEACLAAELELLGLSFQRQVELPVQYKGRALATGYRIDLLVEEEIIVELKAVKEIEPVHKAQLLTYLKLSGKRLGLLLNFNVSVLKNGIRRMILD